jgi:hypothetical protein
MPRHSSTSDWIMVAGAQRCLASNQNIGPGKHMPKDSVLKANGKLLAPSWSRLFIVGSKFLVA